MSHFGVNNTKSVINVLKDRERKDNLLLRKNSSKKLGELSKANAEAHPMDPNNPNISDIIIPELHTLDEVFNTPQKKLLKREDTSENMKITHRYEAGYSERRRAWSILIELSVIN